MSEPTVIEGYLNPVTGKIEWLSHDCPQCMKLILTEEWAAHLAWHGEAEDA